MIRKLKARPRVDTFQNAPRRPGSSWGRFVYLGLLALLGLGLANYVWGDTVFLRADGLTLRDRTLVAATSIVRVEEVHVRPGQRVRADDILLRVGSTEVLDRIADLAMRDAELAEREAALRSRRNLAVSLLPLAERRAAETSELLRSLESLSKQGLVASDRYEQVTVGNYDAETEKVRLATEIEGLEAEIEALVTARGHARLALGDLEAHYNSGVIRAATDGIVGDIVPSVGEAFRAGEPLLSVLSGDPYVLAYLPRSYLFAIESGRSVQVRSGRLTAIGTVTDILPVSQALPAEFQNAFKPDQTRQLARIEFDETSNFPIFGSVEIRQAGSALPNFARRFDTPTAHAGPAD
ncbi:MAG: HlyD family secretion protein [Inquilinaceae bacterium]